MASCRYVPCHVLSHLSLFIQHQHQPTRATIGFMAVRTHRERRHTLSDPCWDNLQNSSEHSSCFYDMSSLCVDVPAMHVCMYACSCSGGKGYTPRGRKRGEVRPSSAPWQTGAKVHTYNVLKRIHPKSKQTAICGLTYHNITQHDITGHSPRE